MLSRISFSQSERWCEDKEGNLRIYNSILTERRVMRKLLIFICSITFVLGISGIAIGYPLYSNNFSYEYIHEDVTADLDGGEIIAGQDPYIRVNQNQTLTLTLSGVQTIDYIGFDLDTFGTWDTSKGDLYDQVVFTAEDQGGLVYGNAYTYADYVSIILSDAPNIDGTLVELIWLVDSTWSDEYIGLDDINVGGTAAAPVPEPATIMLLGAGLVGLAGASRKKLRK
jgi:hypothetical protein